MVISFCLFLLSWFLNTARFSPLLYPQRTFFWLCKSAEVASLSLRAEQLCIALVTRPVVHMTCQSSWSFGVDKLIPAASFQPLITSSVKQAPLSQLSFIRRLSPFIWIRCSYGLSHPRMLLHLALAPASKSLNPFCPLSTPTCPVSFLLLLQPQYGPAALWYILKTNFSTHSISCVTATNQSPAVVQWGLCGRLDSASVWLGLFWKCWCISVCVCVCVCVCGGVCVSPSSHQWKKVAILYL